MHVESQQSDVAGKNLKSLCGVEVILRLPCILLLFKCVHALIKVAHGINVFVCDFMEAVKRAQQEFYQLYCDPYAKFEDPIFDDFNAIEPLPIPTS